MQPLKTLFASENYPQLLAGLAEPDDAAVWRLDDGRALVTTVDFFPPVVDDPYDFGAIAAATALSDVYAVGGEAIMALNLVAFPESLDASVQSEILRGGAEKVLEAGAVIAGGHTVTDDEPKYGLAVTGLVAPQDLLTKGRGTARRPASAHQVPGHRSANDRAEAAAIQPRPARRWQWRA